MVDVFEEEDHLLVLAELPGIGKDDIKVDLKDDVLTITAERGDKKYRKEVLLPCVSRRTKCRSRATTESWKSSARNSRIQFSGVVMTVDTEVLKLKVSEALSKDVGRAYARMGPEDLARLGVEVGDIVEVAGKSKAVCKAMPAYKEMRGQSQIQLDGLTRENAGVGLDEHVQIRPIAAQLRSGWCWPRPTLSLPSVTWITSAAAWTACRWRPSTAFGPSCSDRAGPISKWKARCPRAPC